MSWEVRWAAGRCIFPSQQVETIGDAYMVASGVPVANDKHAVELTQVALDLLTKVVVYEVDHKPG